MRVSEECYRDIDPRSPRDDMMIAPNEPQVPLPAMHEVMTAG
jgi:hypothetical protein